MMSSRWKLRAAALLSGFYEQKSYFLPGAGNNFVLPLCVDATYRICREFWGLIILSIAGLHVDRDFQIRATQKILGCAVAPTEETKRFAFFVGKLQEQLKLRRNGARVRVASDAHSAIAPGFEEVYGENYERSPDPRHLRDNSNNSSPSASTAALFTTYRRCYAVVKM